MGGGLGRILGTTWGSVPTQTLTPPPVPLTFSSSWPAHRNAAERHAGLACHRCCCHGGTPYLSLLLPPTHPPAPWPATRRAGERVAPARWWSSLSAGYSSPCFSAASVRDYTRRCSTESRPGVRYCDLRGPLGAVGSNCHWPLICISFSYLLIPLLYSSFAKVYVELVSKRSSQNCGLNHAPYRARFSP